MKGFFWRTSFFIHPGHELKVVRSEMVRSIISPLRPFKINFATTFHFFLPNEHPRCWHLWLEYSTLISTTHFSSGIETRGLRPWFDPVRSPRKNAENERCDHPQGDDHHLNAWFNPFQPLLWYIYRPNIFPNALLATTIDFIPHSYDG